MIGFLLKILIVTGIVVGVGWFAISKLGGDPKSILSKGPGSLDFKIILAPLAKINPKIIGSNISNSLDSIITHPDRNSPVVLGMKISNDSLDAVIKFIQNLPPDQVEQLKAAMCAPVASPSAQ